jgi:hypothetical protein
LSRCFSSGLNKKFAAGQLQRRLTEGMSNLSSLARRWQGQKKPQLPQNYA